MGLSNSDIQSFINGGQSNQAPVSVRPAAVSSALPSPVGQKRYAIGGGSAQADPAPQGNDAGSGNWLVDMLNTPIIKGVLNVLGTGSYIVGNAMNAPNVRDQQIKDYQKQGLSEQAATDKANSDLLWNMTLGAVGKGLSAGIGQNPNDAVTPSKAIRSYEGTQPYESQNPAANIQDFAADALLDPLNAVSFGPVGAAAKGAIRGVQEASIANKIGKLAGDASKAQPLIQAGIQGAKDAMAARSGDVAAAKAVRGLKQGDIPAEPVSGTLSGFDKTPDVPDTFSSTPDSVIMGTPGKAGDIAAASQKESAIRDVAGSQIDPADKISAVQTVLGRPKDTQSAESVMNIIGDQVKSETPLDVPTKLSVNKAQNVVKPDILDMEPPRQTIRTPQPTPTELTGELPTLSKAQNETIQRITGETRQKLNDAFDSGSPGEAVKAVQDVKPVHPSKMGESDPNDLNQAGIDYEAYLDATAKANQGDLSKVQKFKDWYPQWQAAQQKMAAKVADKFNGIHTSEFASPRERIFHDGPNGTPEGNTAASKAAGDARLKEDQIPHTVENGGMDSRYNVAKHDQYWDIATRFYGLQKFFDRTFGKYLSWEQLTTGQHLITGMSTAFHGVLNDLAKKYTTDEIARAFNILRDGGPVGDVPAARDLQQMMSVIFDPSHNNVFARNGIGKDYFNSILAKNPSIPKTWRVIGETPEEWANSWKDWQGVKNPLKMMEAVHSALMKATADISMAAKYGEHFGLKEVPKGEVGRWMKIDKNSLQTNRFARLIDTSLYYPKEILDELPALNRAITDSRIFKNRTINDLMSEIYDPMVSALKMTQTVMKPGHHLMSIQSDVLRNGMLGLVTPGPYKEAWRILRTRSAGIKGLESLDEYARVRNLGAGVKMHAEGPGKTFANIGAKGTKISNESIYQGLEARDVILPVHSSGLPEDLLTNDALGGVTETHGPLFRGAAKVSQGFDKAVTKLTNNRVIKMNRFTAERDNWNRIALALHYMQSRHFNNMEEAFDYASKMVRRAAPTAKDLTAAESKYARRLIFYYTWQRGILNVLAEAVMERPAIAMLPNKLMYDIALNNGLNPQSYGDPFPPNSVMPDYYRNMVLGPQWKDENGDEWGVNPSSPLMDTMNTLGLGLSVGGLFNGKTEKSAAQTLLGQINPLLKAPIELASGNQLSNGTPIQDPGQYLADLIGPEKVASQLTGLTPSTTSGIARRTEAKYQNGIGDAQQWQANAMPILANWLTGSQLKDYTSAAAQKTAQFQQKDQQVQAKKQDNRTQWFNQ